MGDRVLPRPPARFVTKAVGSLNPEPSPETDKGRWSAVPPTHRVPDLLHGPVPLTTTSEKTTSQTRPPQGTCRPTLPSSYGTPDLGLAPGFACTLHQEHSAQKTRPDVQCPRRPQRPHRAPPRSLLAPSHHGWSLLYQHGPFKGPAGAHDHCERITDV